MRVSASSSAVPQTAGVLGCGRGCHGQWLRVRDCGRNDSPDNPPTYTLRATCGYAAMNSAEGACSPRCRASRCACSPAAPGVLPARTPDLGGLVGLAQRFFLRMSPHVSSGGEGPKARPWPRLRSTIGIADPVRCDATALTCATGSLPAVEDTGNPARHGLSASSLMRPRGETWRAHRQAASAYLLTARSERRPIGRKRVQPADGTSFTRSQSAPDRNMRPYETMGNVRLRRTLPPRPVSTKPPAQPQILLGSSRLEHFLSPATSTRAPNAQPETRRAPGTS